MTMRRKVSDEEWQESGGRKLPPLPPLITVALAESLERLCDRADGIQRLIRERKIEVWRKPR